MHGKLRNIIILVLEEMYKNILSLLKILCVCIHTAQAQLTVTKETTTPVFGESIRLRCNGVGATCCTTETRIWNRDGIVILTNGQETAKYEEEWNVAGQYFTLIINDLAEADLNHAYTCEYGFANTPSPLNLVQDSTYIYRLRESECPVKAAFGYLKGTLSVAKSAPYPNVYASIGGTILTSPSLTITGPTVFDTWFYKVTVSISHKITYKAFCKEAQKFNLSVVTSSRSTDFCYNTDLCNCSSCGLECWGLAIVGATVAALVIFLAVICSVRCKKCYLYVRRIKNGQEYLYLSVVEDTFSRENDSSSDLLALPISKKILIIFWILVISYLLDGVIVNLIPAIPTGICECFCIEDTKYWCILMGLLTYCIGVIVMLLLMCKTKLSCILCCNGWCVYPGKNPVPTVWIKKKQYVIRPGMTETLECTYDSTSPVTQVFWERKNDVTKKIILITTDQEKYLGSTPRNPFLTIRDIEESDAGTYRCVATNSAGNGYSSPTKLIVTETGEKHNK